jgi:TolB-like protein
MTGDEDVTEPPRSFLDALKRRKVVQWAIAYWAAAFVVLQVMDALEGALGLGQTTQLGIVVVLLIGFPLIVTLAWFHGERGRQRVTGAELAIVGGLVVVGLLGLWVFAPSSSPSDREGVEPGADSSIASTPAIAVLPFDDLSPDGDQEYFAAGVAEELVNLLAMLPDLTVVARTSAAAAKNQGLTIREIGDRLGVTTVLDGSLRKAGSRIRITAQLVRVEDEANLWSATYDRDLEDVFAIQSDVAAQIADTLTASLTGGGRPVVARTADPEAYELYLQGRFLWNKRTREDQERALDYFTRAIARDSSFAQAWVGLADTYVILPFYSTILATETMPLARRAAERALALDPDLAEAHTTLAYVTALYDWDFEESDRLFRHALELSPSYADAHKWRSDVLSFMGRHDEALASVETARILDPLSPNVLTIHGLKYWITGDDDRALAEWNRALALAEDFPLTLKYTTRLYWSRGEYELFFRELEGLEVGAVPLLVPLDRLRTAYSEGGAHAVLRLQADAPEARAYPMERARWLMELGDLDGAFSALDQAFEERSVWLPFLINQPDLEALREDSRYDVLLRRMGIERQ